MNRKWKPGRERLPYCPTGDSDRAIESVWPVLERKIRRAAEAITGERDFQADLVQEAQIMLWEVDPTRFDFRRPAEQAYVGQMLVNRMRNVWRAELVRRGCGDEVKGVASD